MKGDVMPLRIHLAELLAHAQKTLELHKTHIGDKENGFWLIHPRDFHFLKSELDQDKLLVGDKPSLAGIEAVLCHSWRKPPIIAMNISEIQFLP